MYSMTATQRKEAKRASRIFYQTHCKDCRCELTENEYEYCSDCELEYENFNKAEIILQCLFPRISEDVIFDTVSKVMDTTNGKSYYPISMDQIDAAKSILNSINI